MSEARRGPAAPLSTHYTFCRICEASCGLEVEVQDNRVTKIRPDAAHPVTKGYACVKGIRFDEVQHAPDRVVQPLARKDGTPALGGKAHATNRLYMHPDDASEAGLADGDLAEVGNEHGSVRAPVRISDDLMRYVVALPHGWGHRESGLAYASEHRAGVNVNALAGDGVRNTERLSGMAQLTAFPVRVKSVGDPDRAEER